VCVCVYVCVRERKRETCVCMCVVSVHMCVSDEHEFGRVPSISFIFTGSKLARIALV